MTTVTFLICLLVGPLTVTSYQSIPSQTDSSPNYTSIGDRTHKGGIAVSQDLLCPASKHCRRNRRGCKPTKIHYGDYLYVKDLGIYQVNDCLHARFKNHLDVWVDSREAEKAFDKKYGIRQFIVYRVQFNEK